MPNDPYAILRALLRADAARHAPKPNPDTVRTPRPDKVRDAASPSSPTPPAPLTPLTPPAVAPRKPGERG
ncbi:hypothetical protein GFH48_21370 [Streptomyces fagopyri]|uniref:Uncharacterized protein n=1 Tax=Streptomyces fagopyri TaxID=2662397 RepID=A0A5Q0LFT4_9ACTN|nr:hypothetical protein [Streptomyces fagopyri]QFZ75476.1 hypothetical protein GFH48_21370 [Streptomyces fagopyri]